MTDGPIPTPVRHPADKGAFVIALILAGVAVLIAWSTYRMPGAASYARIGPTAFPYAIAAGLLALSVGTAIAALRGRFPERESDRIEPIIWIVGGLAAQMLLLKTAGFSIATGLMFAATAKAFGRGPLWLAVPIGIVFSLFVWVIFARLLQLSLPAGPLEQLFR